MAQFKAMAPNVEVNGPTVMSIINGMGVFQARALAILAKHGIPQPKSDQWYPQQAWLKAFEEISLTIGKTTLFQIGTKIPESAKFPPTITNIEQALGAIDVAYHMNHRGGQIGNYHCQVAGERRVKMVCANPYPCDFDRGIIQAMARRFKPAIASPLVKHDDACPCRSRGGESCTYWVTW